jgi:hypothetical protein
VRARGSTLAARSKKFNGIVPNALFLMMMLIGPVGAQIITAIVPFAQKPPEEDEPAQNSDNQKIGDALRAEHEIVQCMDGVSHDFSPATFCVMLYCSERFKGTGFRAKPD